MITDVLVTLGLLSFIAQVYFFFVKRDLAACLIAGLICLLFLVGPALAVGGAEYHVITNSTSGVSTTIEKTGYVAEWVSGNVLMWISFISLTFSIIAVILLIVGAYMRWI